METRHGRRDFLVGGGSIMVAGLTAGALSGLGQADASAEVAVQPLAPQKGDREVVIRNASFGWELSDLNNNGADAYFKVTRPMSLAFVDVDVAYMLTTRKRQISVHIGVAGTIEQG